MQTEQRIVDIEGEGFVFITNTRSAPKLPLGTLTGKELVFACLDHWERHKVWNFSEEDTRRFIEIATNVHIRATFQPESIPMIDEFLRTVILPTAPCTSCTRP